MCTLKHDEMTTRRVLQGVGNNFLSSFISRNNDCNGYWGIGKLYKFALARGSTQIKINLLNLESKPRKSVPQHLSIQYRDRLKLLLDKHAIPETWVVETQLDLQFSPYMPIVSLVSSIFSPTGQDYKGDAFDCVLALKDDLGKVHQSKASGYCWPHDPALESQSLRVQGTP